MRVGPRILLREWILVQKVASPPYAVKQRLAWIIIDKWTAVIAVSRKSIYE
jgi:hypothetical protein